MRVGIVSMQRVVNYGSFLQAYSLKSMVESLGHTCVFLDIADENGTFDYADAYEPKWYWLRAAYRKLTRPITHRLYQEREYLFKKKLIRQLGMTEAYKIDRSCRAVILGSDEIFNCCQVSPWGQTMALFGENVHPEILISYAASFGFTTEALLLEYGLYDDVKRCLSRFNEISVRDHNSRCLVEKMTGKRPVKNLDPVLMYDYPERKRYKVKFRNYLVVYGYDNRICEPEIISQIQLFAKENNLKTVALGMQQDWCDINYLPHPFELLRIIEQADYVVTDTFHGTVFSIKYQKRFASIIRQSNQQKLSDLLDTFGLLGRRVTKAEDITTILGEEYDHDAVKAVLSQERQNTTDYLHRWLQDEIG